LSFDGKQIGISSGVIDKNIKSLIYILPVEGGEPIQITEKSPSYLHGWSPNGNELIFTGGRNGQFDIYK
jgi:Tol biopolymer transport system component